MFAEEILSEIDTTLDRLIRNAETMNGVEITNLTESEVDAFEKTQESLLHHLLHMDQILENKRKTNPLQNSKSSSFKIQDKIKRFEKLKTSINDSIRKAEKKMPLLSKRHRKKLIY